MDVCSNIVAVIGVVALIVLLKLWKRATKQEHKGKPIPEVAGRLPIIGHMHLFRQNKSLGRIFGAFADKYGPIFSVRFGMHPAIFISDYNAVKERFTVKDTLMSSRPYTTHSTLVGYNGSSFAFAPYGPFWRDMRKLLAIKLLCTTRIKALNYIPESELNYLVNNLYNLSSHSNDKIDLSERFLQMSINTITRMVAGKRVFDGNEGSKPRSFSHIAKELLDVSSQVVLGDVIPFIGWLDIGGVVKTMKSICDEVSVIVDGWIEEHKLNLKNKAEDKKDFIDVMLTEVTDDEEMGFDQSSIIKGTAMTMITGGSDTTAISLTWVLTNLLNNKKALERCQEELDLKIGRNRWVQNEDLHKLEYLTAVIKESFRLNPPGPIATPKEVEEDCYISGYFIPKGTHLFVNVWKLHRDPTIWSNPNEFIPERFLNEKSHVQVTGNNFEFLPFGGGRRICPAVTFGWNTLNLGAARILQGFNITTPNNKPVDMTEGRAIIMTKEYPLEVVLTPRLAPHLYDLECNLS